MDIYSVGATIYAILSGKAPYHYGNSKMVNIDQYLTLPKEYIQEKTSGTFAEFVASKMERGILPSFKLYTDSTFDPLIHVMNKCMALEPEDRWDTKQLLQFVKNAQGNYCFAVSFFIFFNFFVIMIINKIN